MNRKIIQFQLNEKCCVALCDDGTLWSLGEYWSTWMKVPAVPTDDEYDKQTREQLERMQMLVKS